MTDALRTLKQQIADLRAAHRERLSVLRSEVDDARADLAAMLRAHRADRADAAEADRAARRDRLAALRDAVDAARGEVALMLDTFADERHAAAEAGRTARTDAVAAARAAVATLRDEVRGALAADADARAERTAEAARARRAFLDRLRADVHRTLAPAQVTHQPAAPAGATPDAEPPAPTDAAPSARAGAPGGAAPGVTPPASTPADTPDAEDADTPVPRPFTLPSRSGADGSFDNLAVIQGIGPKMAFRLREAGITTYERMAAASPADIRRLMGGLPSFADVESWIEQAAARAEQKKQASEGDEG